jgi:hypothetical protein
VLHLLAPLFAFLLMLPLCRRYAHSVTFLLTRKEAITIARLINFLPPFR